MAHRILVLANETLRGEELLDDLRSRSEKPDCEVRVVAPGLAETAFELHAGAVDEGIDAARNRLSETLEELGRHGIAAEGAIGDADPLIALKDAIGLFPADELVISTHPPDRSRWLEQEVVDSARREFDIPITHVIVGAPGNDGEPDVRQLEPRDPTPAEKAAEEGRSTRDIMGIVVAVLGTLILWVLAGTSIEGEATGTEAARFLIAIGAFLISVWHVVGLLFFEATRYRGVWAKVTADMILFGMPPAVLASALLVVLA